MSYNPDKVNSEFENTENDPNMEESQKCAEIKEIDSSFGTEEAETESEKEARDKGLDINDTYEYCDIESKTENAIAEDHNDFDEPYNDISEETQELVKKRNTKGFIFDLIFYVILVFVCIYVIPNYVVQRTVVDGSSMESTLHDKDQLYVEKISYHFDALKRFDIIVFYPYGRKAGDYYVKRIIGLPGETVQIIGSDIYINGKILKENYGKDPITDPGRAADPITLDDDEYFVLGDNRSISKDSRTEDVGNVKRENIGGRVVLRIKPLSKFGTVD